MAHKRKPAPQRARQLVVVPFALERFPAQQAAAETPVAPDASALGEREFEGIASAYGVLFERLDTERWERVATILEPGSWNASVAALNARPGDRAGRVPVLRNHSQLLGRSLTLEAAMDGLRFRARVTDEPEAMAWYAHILAGAADGVSVGFVIDQSTIKRHEELGGEMVEHVTAASLLEITSCVWGANPGAMVESAASGETPGPAAPTRTPQDVQLGRDAVALAGLERELKYAHERIDMLQAELQLR